MEKTESLTRVRKALESYVRRNWDCEIDLDRLNPDRVPADEPCRYPLYFLWLYNEEFFRTYATNELREYMVYGIFILTDMYKLPRHQTDPHFIDLIESLDELYRIGAIRRIFRSTGKPENISDSSLERFVLELMEYGE